MSTTSSIGTASRNYSTITAWHAAFANGGWIGECYNDSEFQEGPSIGGTSAANYEILCCATGQSAFDSSANPLKYDQSKGVGIRQTSAFGKTLTLGSYVTIQGLQLNNNVFAAQETVYFNSFLTNPIVSRCLIQNEVYASFTINYDGGSSGCSITNTVVISFVGSAFYGNYTNGLTFANCTFVSPSDKSNANVGININNQSPTITNCAVFGFSGGFKGGSGTPSGSNNASDLSTVGFGTSNQTSLTYANQFNSVTSSAMDFRVKSGSSLPANGLTDTTDIPAANDIFNQARGSSWTIGANQYSAGGGAAGTCAGAAVVAGVGKTLRQCAGSMSGIATTNFVGRARAAASASCVGAAVVAGVGKTFRKTSGTCAGAAVVASAGVALRITAGTCAGAAVVSGATHKRIAAAGICAGAAVVAGVGKTIISTSATCLGVATLSGHARGMAAMTGHCVGSSSANGVTSGSVAPTAATCLGVAVVSGFGAQRRAAAGTCAGISSLSGVGKTFRPTAGACIGIAVVNGAGRVRVPAAGACAGLAVLSGATHKRIGGAGACAGAAAVLGVSGNGGITPAKGVIIAGAVVHGYGGAEPMANYPNILEGDREYA